MSNDKLKRDLAAVLNAHGVDNACNTPDYLLAEYIVRRLDFIRSCAHTSSRAVVDPMTQQMSMVCRDCGVPTR